MRRSLYVKDDDYRHSFLFGNFATLTNLSGEDWIRLEEQRLSPLYVSVHATEMDVRKRILGREDTPDIVAQLRRLGELGIEVHAQVVLVPGLNDGPHLAQTLADLMPLHQSPVASLGVVPVGLTRYHRGSCRLYTPAESRQVLDQLLPWQQQARANWGETWVQASDEWYLVAGRPVPPAAAYDDFPQWENGVGMVRLLRDEWAQMRRRAIVRHTGRATTLVCGILIAPVLAEIVKELGAQFGIEVDLVPIANQFFGEVTTVSGLLTAQDVLGALRGRSLGELLLLPQAMFTGRYGAGLAPPGTTLDDVHISDIAAALGVRVEMAGTLTEALSYL
jgi:putative radical SAM enzyme (TIGR03279 family)